jgi:hypothetical protein
MYVVEARPPTSGEDDIGGYHLGEQIYENTLKKKRVNVKGKRRNKGKMDGRRVNYS